MEVVRPNIFQADLRASALCHDGRWDGLDGDGLVQLYDDTIVALLGGQISVRTTCCRRRPSNVFFDDERRQAKRHLQFAERVARRDGPLSNLSSPSVIAWRAECRRSEVL